MTIALEHQVKADHSFPTEIQTARARDSAHLAQSAIGAGYSADRATLLQLLNDALATELVCVLRYRRHSFMARGMRSQRVAEEFLDHSNEELQHADQLAERIVQLGGAPDFAPDGLTGRSHAEYLGGYTLASMIRENLVAERIAVDNYRDVVRYLGGDDPVTCRMIEGILLVAEEHADELSDLLSAFAVESRRDKQTIESP